MKDQIIDFLKNYYNAVAMDTIASNIGITKDNFLEFKEALIDLCNENILYQSRKSKGQNYILLDNCRDIKKGTMILNRGGFGFVRVKGMDEDIHISYDRVNNALDDDLVLVEIIDSKSNEGRILKILSRSKKNIVGEIKKSKKGLYFLPNDKKITKINIDADEFKSCVEGEIVAAKIISENPIGTFNCVIDRHIGHKDDPNMDILTIAADHDIMAVFPEDAMHQAEDTANEVDPDEIPNRLDLRDKVIFTIDGADTKDIDDAISLEIINGEYHLGVHIADVSYYVTEDSPLDIEARERGNSAYLADTVIPMLPHKLSNGICSLNEGVDRFAMSCLMTINNNGKVIDYEVKPSIIRSRKKMTYDNVNMILEDNIIPEGYMEFADTLKSMQALAHIIRRERYQRGASDFGSSEVKAICDDDGKCIEIKKCVQREGEKLIEDFMIAANETIAKIFINNDLTGMYRIHENPSEEKLERFLGLCSILGIQIIGKYKNVKAKMFQKLIEQINNSNLLDEAKPIILNSAIRSMAKAKYSTENLGHFGLASRNYTHFTSPIRRYCDLTVHRLLRCYLFSNNDYNTIRTLSGKYATSLVDVANHISETEVNAQEAEREVDKMKMAEYMESHIGEEYNAIISGFNGMGMFVQLDNLIEGLLPFESLDDFYNLDSSEAFAIGESTGNTFTLGDKIYVKCVNASKEKKQIDFAFIKKVD